jgi:uncharacterized protein YjbI with pentapeptide repeats
MANQQQLDQLQKSVGKWNIWRLLNKDIIINLSGADLNGAELSGANFYDANLSRADLSRADLSSANLSRADLSRADLRGADFTDTNLRDADLRGANLSDANLSGADLSDANLNVADLSRANLSSANLSGANLSDANLSSADFSRADISIANLSGANLSYANLSDTLIGWTSFGDRDLRKVKGLATIRHAGPSPLSINTIYQSEGDIPETFVRGTGTPDSFIEYMHALASKPIQYYTCFISYTQKDQAFAERLYSDLQNKSVRCWYAPKELKPGDYYRHRIDESIRIYDKLLVILSEESIQSPEVEKEVKKAEEREESMPMDSQVLYPIRLDDIVMQTRRRWVKLLRDHRHIGDFTKWKDHDHYQQAFQRLLDDIKHPKPRQRHHAN